MYDVIIIGGGVIGCACARELSRFRLKTLVVERENDLCSGTSKANSAIAHAGYDAVPGTLKARLNREGARLMPHLARELDFLYRQNGSLVVCTDEKDIPALEALYRRGLENGIDELELLGREEVQRLEPNLSADVRGALRAKGGGILCPFGLTLALGENAKANGVDFQLNCSVESLERTEEGYRLVTNKGELSTRVVVNAAGIYGDVIHNSVSRRKLHIVPRRGEYLLFDKSEGGHVNHTIFSLPGPLGKGVLVTPTVHGNLMAGPTARDVEDKEATATTYEGLEEVKMKAAKIVRGLRQDRVITSFAGLRAHEDSDDFIIGEAEDAPGFIDAVGTESPGLVSSPAVGRMVADIVADKLQPKENSSFDPRRRGIRLFHELSREEQRKKIGENSAYGNILCRCEQISEGDILEAIHRPLGARDVDGLKRRVRVTSGRCQGGFCTPKILEILSRELGVAPEEITKSGEGSRMLAGPTRGQEDTYDGNL